VLIDKLISYLAADYNHQVQCHLFAAGGYATANAHADINYE
jgi:hypothetical protein